MVQKSLQLRNSVGSMEKLRKRKQEALDYYQQTKDPTMRAELRRIDKLIKSKLKEQDKHL